MARTFFFSPSEMGFFDPAVFSEMPSDVVEIGEAQYRQLIGSGKSIVVGADGLPAIALEVVLSLEELMERDRAWRDALLLRYGGLRDRHRDEVELGMVTTLTGDQYAELLALLQELRDWPQSELFPAAEHRPVPPTWLAELTQ